MTVIRNSALELWSDWATLRFFYMARCMLPPLTPRLLNPSPSSVGNHPRATSLHITLASTPLPLALLSTAMPPKQHHCSYIGCKSTKAACTKHYWNCTGCDVSHVSEKIFKGNSCEKNVKRGDKMEKCRKKVGRLV